MYREAGGADTEFHDKLLAARDRRLLTVEEMCRMAKVSKATMENWLNGLTAPFSQVGREAVIRAVE